VNVDTIGIGPDAAGILNPLLATFTHVASELLSSHRQVFAPAREKSKIIAHEPVTVRSEGAGRAAHILPTA
jgi:hypothetical protein